MRDLSVETGESRPFFLGGKLLLRKSLQRASQKIKMSHNTANDERYIVPPEPLTVKEIDRLMSAYVRKHNDARPVIMAGMDNQNGDNEEKKKYIVRQEPLTVEEMDHLLSRSIAARNKLFAPSGAIGATGVTGPTR
jgi:hypothetical protein